MTAARARKPRSSRATDDFTLRESIHRTIDALVVSRVPLVDAMPALLHVSRATCLSPLWDQLLRIKWGNSVAPAVAAFRKTVIANRPPAKLGAIFFEMPEIAFNEPIIGWVGMWAYKPDDADGEYVTGTLAWPNDKSPQASLPIKALEQVIKIAGSSLDRYDDADDEDDNPVMIPLFACSMGFTCFLAAEIAGAVEPKLLVKGRKPIGITAGPAGGEYHALGELTLKGWKPKPKCWLSSEDSGDDEG